MALKPGITAKQFSEALVSPIRAAGYKSLRPPFHGLGLTSEEPLGTAIPEGSCVPNDAFLIEAGMVIEFEPHIMTQDGKKGVTLRGPVLVTDTGCRPMGKNKIEPKIIRL